MQTNTTYVVPPNRKSRGNDYHHWLAAFFPLLMSVAIVIVVVLPFQPAIALISSTAIKFTQNHIPHTLHMLGKKRLPTINEHTNSKQIIKKNPREYAQIHIIRALPSEKELQTLPATTNRPTKMSTMSNDKTTEWPTRFVSHSGETIKLHYNYKRHGTFTNVV